MYWTTWHRQRAEGSRLKTRTRLSERFADAIRWQPRLSAPGAPWGYLPAAEVEGEVAPAEEGHDVLLADFALEAHLVEVVAVLHFRAVLVHEEARRLVQARVDYLDRTQERKQRPRPRCPFGTRRFETAQGMGHKSQAGYG